MSLILEDVILKDVVLKMWVGERMLPLKPWLAINSKNTLWFQRCYEHMHILESSKYSNFCIQKADWEEREREKALPSTGSLPGCPKWPRLGWAEARSQELHPGLPSGRQGHRHLLPLRVCTAKEVLLGAGTGIRTRDSGISTLLPTTCPSNLSKVIIIIDSK